MPAIVFGAALLLSLALHPQVRAWSVRTGRVAHPRQDRWHRRDTALMGGLAIFAAFAAATALAGVLFGFETIPWGLLAGSAMVFGLGLYDDLRPMTPQAKLIGQFLAAALVISLGYTTNFFTPRLADTLLAQLPNILLTFFWLVGITNAINLLDNMDGLAGGIALITALFISFFFWEGGNTGLLLVALALAGSVLGFLFFNFPPASIFMGDSGSLFLGFTLAGLAIARQPQASNVFAVLGVPTLLFLLPILDTTLVTFTRLLRGQSPVVGGRDHTSHRLIASGLNERQAVLILYGAALFSGLVAAAMESLNYWFSLAVAPLVLVGLALLTAYLGGIKVVPGTAPAARGAALSRIMLQLTFRGRILEVLLDFSLIGIALYLAFLTRAGLIMTSSQLEMYLQTLPLALGSVYLTFFIFGVYRGVWRYVGVSELVHYVQAAVGGALLTAALVLMVYSSQAYPASIFILFGVYLFLGLAASRSSFRVLDRLLRVQPRPLEQRVVICGAGDAGEMAVRWIEMNPRLSYRPVGFIDPDPFKAGRQIHGVSVLGTLNNLENILEERQVNGLILAVDESFPGEVQERVIALCRRRGCWVRSLRLEFELVE